MKRMAGVIGIKAEQLSEYKRLHAAVWPTVLERIERCHIRNYSIFLREPEMLLFSYFEYHGDDFERDSAAMAADPQTQAWWAICGPMQEPLSTRSPGEHWAALEEVFHTD